MPKKVEEQPLVKHTVRLFQGQMDRLVELHGGRIGSNKLLRTIIAAYIQKVEARVEQNRETTIVVDDIEVAR